MSSTRAGSGSDPGARRRTAPRRPPASYVIAATFAVTVLPVLAGWSIAFSFPGESSVAVALLAGVALSLVACLVGDAVWSRRAESRHFAFRDLMLWNAMRSIGAQRRVESKAHLLGFDLNGRFAGHVRVPADQQLEIARDISYALESKSAYTRGHSQRVEEHARRIASDLEMGKDDIDQLAIAATLHDIGNIQIPDEVLHKVDELTIEERAAIEGHVLLGSAMAFTAGSAQVMEAVRYHHEWWDGTGYPSRLVGGEIPLFARIIAVAEAYDAMVSPRPYRRGYPRDRALELVRSHAGSQFDPTVVAAFIRTIPTPIEAAVLAPVLGAARRTGAVLRTAGGGSVALAAATVGLSIVVATAVVSPTDLDSPLAPLEPRTTARANRAPITIAAPSSGHATRNGTTARRGESRRVADETDVVLGERITRASESDGGRVAGAIEPGGSNGEILPDGPDRGSPGRPARPGEDGGSGSEGTSDGHGRGAGNGHVKARGKGHHKGRGGGHDRDPDGVEQRAQESDGPGRDEHGVPPGHAKRHGVPPGHAKKHGVPPGHAKKHGAPPGHAKKHGPRKGRGK